MAALVIKVSIGRTRVEHAGRLRHAAHRADGPSPAPRSRDRCHPGLQRSKRRHEEIHGSLCSRPRAQPPGVPAPAAQPCRFCLRIRSESPDTGDQFSSKVNMRDCPFCPSPPAGGEIPLLGERRCFPNARFHNSNAGEDFPQAPLGDALSGTFNVLRRM